MPPGNARSLQPASHQVTRRRRCCSIPIPEPGEGRRRPQGTRLRSREVDRLPPVGSRRAARGGPPATGRDVRRPNDRPSRSDRGRETPTRPVDERNRRRRRFLRRFPAILPQDHQSDDIPDSRSRACAITESTCLRYEVGMWVESRCWTCRVAFHRGLRLNRS